MAKCKLGMSSFDINIKFKDKEEARRYAKRVLEKLDIYVRKRIGQQQQWYVLVILRGIKP